MVPSTKVTASKQAMSWGTAPGKPTPREFPSAKPTAGQWLLSSLGTAAQLERGVQPIPPILRVQPLTLHRYSHCSQKVTLYLLASISLFCGPTESGDYQ